MWDPYASDACHWWVHQAACSYDLGWPVDGAVAAPGGAEAWRTVRASSEERRPPVEPLPLPEDVACNMSLVALLGAGPSEAAQLASEVGHPLWQQDTSDSSEAVLDIEHTQQAFQGSDCRG